MKKILLVVHAAQKREGHLNWTAFRDVIGERLSGEAEVAICSLGDLLFVLDGDRTTVKDTRFDNVVDDFDLVVFRTIGGRLEEAIALAAYCRKKDIPYIDEYIPTIGNQKLSCAFVRWEHDLPVPKTVYGPVEAMITAVDSIGLPAVLKANEGKKGRDNYLVNSVKEIRDRVLSKDAPRFVLQNFIKNDGDFRILVLNGKARMAIKRTAAVGSHLNNTSQGGDAAIVDLATLPESLIKFAEKATDIERLSIAGADLIIDSDSGKPYILEVNRAPQIATGGMADRKIDVYAEALKEILRSKK